MSVVRLQPSGRREIVVAGPTMSVSISVFLKAARLPMPEDWQAAIRKAGFEVELDTDFDPQTFGGFLPARYRGLTAGFEYCLDRIAGTDLGSERRASAASGQDLCITLVTHSEMVEMISAVLAAAALAEFTGGVLFDDESDQAHASATAIAWARGVESEAVPHV